MYLDVHTWKIATASVHATAHMATTRCIHEIFEVI